MPSWPGNDDAAWDKMTYEDLAWMKADLERHATFDHAVATLIRELEGYKKRLDTFRERMLSNEYDYIDGRLWETSDKVGQALEVLQMVKGVRSVGRDGITGLPKAKTTEKGGS